MTAPENDPILGTYQCGDCGRVCDVAEDCPRLDAPTPGMRTGRVGPFSWWLFGRHQLSVGAHTRGRWGCVSLHWAMPYRVFGIGVRHDEDGLTVDVGVWPITARLQAEPR